MNLGLDVSWPYGLLAGRPYAKDSYNVALHCKQCPISLAPRDLKQEMSYVTLKMAILVRKPAREWIGFKAGNGLVESGR